MSQASDTNISPPFTAEPPFDIPSPQPPKTPKAQKPSRALTIPAAYHDASNNLCTIDRNSHSSFRSYLNHELDVSRLNAVHTHLWLAGRPMAARPLHRQILLSRSIVLTEQADLHLVWRESTLYLKPLPEFLLDAEIWKLHLCDEQEIYERACGFLLSYMWLICHKSDFQAARKTGLLSSDVSWENWCAFSSSFLSKIDYDGSLRGINRRYHYGELRLARLNWIYRLSPQTWRTAFVRGYSFGYNRYSVFVQRNFAWFLSAVVYITIVLTAMQVGLATERLGNDDRFQRASYGFTVFSILAPLIGLAVVALLLFFFFMFNFLATIAFLKKVEKTRGSMNMPHEGSQPSSEQAQTQKPIGEQDLNV
ncbi:hypothetical protein MMC09_005880 [Bachmanniomyces sp. S44760]|nr:hypothetical protein [Bachmanniomyces sp. S44760]